MPLRANSPNTVITRGRCGGGLRLTHTVGARDPIGATAEGRRRAITAAGITVTTAGIACNGSLLQLSSPGRAQWLTRQNLIKEAALNGVIYIVGLIVVVLAILSFLGLR